VTTHQPGLGNHISSHHSWLVSGGDLLGRTSATLTTQQCRRAFWDAPRPVGQQRHGVQYYTRGRQADELISPVYQSSHTQQYATLPPLQCTAATGSSNQPASEATTPTAGPQQIAAAAEPA